MDKPTKKRIRKPHSEETRRKIAVANTGKVFPQERRDNIGNARVVILPDHVMSELQSFWEKRYIPSEWIMKKLDISSRVYWRVRDKFCDVEQVKFLPQDLSPDAFEEIISLTRQGVPFKDVAARLKITEKKMRNIILKLAPYYDLKIIQRPRLPKSPSHREKIRDCLIWYNKEFPKIGHKNGNWQGGISELHMQIRNMEPYSDWRMFVLFRDRFTCVSCGSKRDLQVDHIYPFCLLILDGKITSTEEARSFTPLWDTSNGRTLCADCHSKTETFAKKSKQQRAIQNAKQPTISTEVH